MIRRIFIYLLICALARAQVASIIPSTDRVDWTVGTMVGVRGGIPNRTTIFTTISAGASSATIQAALDTCPTGQVVLLGPGTFNATAKLDIRSNTTLRGSGVGVTAYHSNVGGTVLSMAGGGGVGSFINVNSGYTKGSTGIVTATSASVTAGDFIGLTQDNESWVWDAAGGTNMIYSLQRVEAGTSGTSVNLWPGVLYAGTSKNPKIQKFTGTFIQGASIENMDIYPDNAGDSRAISMTAVYGCWLQNLKIHNIQAVGVWLSQAIGCEIRHVDVPDVAAGGADGYGIDVDNSDKSPTACAIYDNQFINCRHGIITSGANGFVFAFNFTYYEHAGTSVQQQTPGFNASHGAEGMMCLWESNYGNSINGDAIHGGSAFQINWRSRHHGVDLYTNVSKPNIATERNSMIDMDKGSWTWWTVGCTLGDTWSATHDASHVYIWTQPGFDNASGTDYGGIFMPGYAGFGQPLDTTFSSNFKYRNYSYYQGAIQDDGAFTVDASLGWPAGKPDWFGFLAWPAYDPASPAVFSDAEASKIPAGYRYFHGGADPTAVQLKSGRYRRGVVTTVPQ